MTREQSLIDQDFQSDGNFGFGGRYSGDNFADFLGANSTFNQITPLYVNLVRNLYGLYLQDNDFKVNRNLTLNSGLRWNPFVPFTDIPANQISQFDQAAYDAGVKSQRFANFKRPPGCRISRSTALGRECSLGTAGIRGWDLPGMCLATQQTSVRAGFGRFHDQMSALTYKQATDFASEFRSRGHHRSVQHDRSLPRLLQSVPASEADIFQSDVPDAVPVCGVRPGLHVPRHLSSGTYRSSKPCSGSMVARVAYQGSIGRNLFHAAELNPAIYGTGRGSHQHGPAELVGVYAADLCRHLWAIKLSRARAQFRTADE